ncbi:cation diffusion facilitator family transporter [Glaciecola sp. XM2]|jgi:cation diffusion facilitator family transporter|uniref:cation diffusion facilitator family transporter n=1 Tax=Glaciecola sp. XM2 TaxID=1914931 RepID=UPI001BDE199D|nr:cation diffusion facilitator family transporter [Glaciecola sp. XM2]MBT1449622.1 cation diffusion facilitator family transporter [Glaciecola sp. XM2]
MNVKKVLIIEGSINLIMMSIKLMVGLVTHSTAILADAFHSLTDVSNNIIAWFAVKQAELPADADHNYGHSKFIPLAIFFLATMLCVVALEVIVHALERIGEPVLNSTYGLGVMVLVLVLNTCLSIWQSYWAKRLDSSLLKADASHTFSDVLTSIAVIVGWQLAARGYYWLDTVFALVVAAIILYLAYQLFLSSIPILVDKNLLDQAIISRRIKAMPLVLSVTSVRTRSDGKTNFADIVISVDSKVSLSVSHDLTDDIEKVLRSEFDIQDATVHVEPLVK